MATRLSDIARLAGVSKSTASRALADSPLVKEETKQIVRRIAKENNYQPNALAQAVATKRSGILGFCMHKHAPPYFGHPFFGPMLDGAIEECKDHGYHIVVAPADPRNTTFDEHFIQDSIDGVILASFTPMDAVREFRRRKIPLVLVNDALPDFNNASIISDDYGGARQMMEHLIVERGYRSIAFLSDRLSHLSYYLRFQAYLDVHREHGVALYHHPAAVCEDPWDGYPAPDSQKLEFLGRPPVSLEGTPLVVHSNRSLDSYRAVRQILASGAPPSAIFAATDNLALGALKAISEAGLRVPQDIAVAGYDDVEIASISQPPLTTVHSDPFDMGRLAVRELLAQIDRPDLACRLVCSPVSLVVREST